MKLFMGFNFYGAGNVGDDLMLAGLTEHLKSKPDYEVSCFCPYNINSQRKRFPEIKWYKEYRRINILHSYYRQRIIKKHDKWIGVGDTPFQNTGGSWLVDHILNDCEKISIPKYMLGVGAEKEAIDLKDRISRIIDSMEKIWTRDRFSEEFLSYISKNEGKYKIIEGCDLANISLYKIFKKNNELDNRKIDIGFNFFAEEKNIEDINQICDFINKISSNKSILYFANETRKGPYFEYGYYKLINKRIQSKIQFFSPSYSDDTIEDLVSHYKNYKVVITSRYHSLLIAAWAGCKVVCLHRSSKVSELAKQLDIPIVMPPFTAENIQNGYESAKTVEIRKLEELYTKANEMVNAFFESL